MSDKLNQPPSGMTEQEQVMQQYNSLTTLFKARHYRDPHGDLVHAEKLNAIWPFVKGAILLALFMLSAGVVMATFAAIWGLVA